MYPNQAMETFLTAMVIGSVVFIFGIMLIWIWKCCYECANREMLVPQQWMVHHLRCLVDQVQKSTPPARQAQTPASQATRSPPMETGEVPRLHAVVDQIQLELHPLLSQPPS